MVPQAGAHGTGLFDRTFDYPRGAKPGKATGERCPGFYVKTHESGGQPIRYSPLYLDLDSNSTWQPIDRLCMEEWECIVIGYDSMRDKEHHLPQILVCEWEGQIARRIGIVPLSMAACAPLSDVHCRS
jgi:hypothetical protein